MLARAWVCTVVAQSSGRLDEGLSLWKRESNREAWNGCPLDSLPLGQESLLSLELRPRRSQPGQTPISHFGFVEGDCSQPWASQDSVGCGPWGRGRPG